MEIVLHREVCRPSLYAVLKDLMGADELQDFYLVGGTAIALHLGHRESYDIDLFSSSSFNAPQLTFNLIKQFNLEHTVHEENTIRGFINGIKVELFTHNYDLIDDVIEFDGIRIAGLRDLSAMKLNAVAGRGSKKDFWDIAAILERHSLKEMISYFRTKHPNADEWHLIKSLSYFEDAEQENIKIMDMQGITWQQVQDKVLTALTTVSPH